MKKKDSHVTISISASDASSGRKVRVSRKNGPGLLKVTIPAGTEDGDMFEVPGEGLNGGNLVLTIRVKAPTLGSISKRVRRQSPKKPIKRPYSLSVGSTASPTITPEIQEILELVEASGGNVIFVTGPAGTGKSTLIDIFREKTQKNLVVVAPTGLAAINSGGQTIHSFFQLAPEPQPEPKVMRGAKGKLIKMMDILVIDEVSMVRADLIDSIAKSLRINTNNRSQPFAGKTVVLVGDMHQMPPIVSTEAERMLFQERYDTEYWFSAESMREVVLVRKELTEVFRQKEKGFADLLGNIRVGKDLERTIAVLNERCYRSGGASEASMTLTTNNAKADQINENKLSSIDKPKFIYEATVVGKFPDRESSLPAPRILELKVGAQVMFLKNNAHWVNGTTGTVLELDDKCASVNIEEGPYKGVVTVEKETWENKRYTWDEESEEVKTEVIGTYTQLPFRLAWAVTIHKAQGLTLESVMIDLDRGTFAPGQAYVALSRCRTMDGLSLRRPLRLGDVKTSRTIIDFHAELSG